MSTKARKPALYNFREFTTIEDARRVTRQGAIYYYILGVLNIAAIIQYHRPECMVNGVLFILCGYLLKRYQSRAAAVYPCIPIAVGLVTSIITALVVSTFFIASVVLMGVLLFCGIRTTQASFFYHDLVQMQVNVRNLLLKSLLSILYSLVGTLICFVCIVLFASDLDDKTEVILISFMILLTVVTATVWTFEGYLPFTKNKVVCTRQIEEDINAYVE